MSLKEYQRKRNFNQSPEPEGKVDSGQGSLRFVVQRHHATRAHYDFRIEMDGTFKSWAVPRGPSLNPNDQRLAVFVEDHPIEYGGFEGTIPKGNYGAGTVMIWDAGTFVERTSSTAEESIPKLLKGLANGHITIVMSGRKIAGEFALVKLKDSKDPNAWLLLKKRDEFASYTIDVTEQDRSVATARSMDEIRTQSEIEGTIWLPGKGIGDPTLLHQLYFSGERLQPIKKKREFQLKRVKPAELYNIEDAPEELIPRKNKPMVPKKGGEPFTSSDFDFIVAGGGKRAIAEVHQGQCNFYSRSGLDFRRKYPDVYRALAKIQQSLVIDGEIMEADGSNRLQVFDLLHLNGRNTRVLTLRERTRVLAGLDIWNEVIRLSPTWSEAQTSLSHARAWGEKSIVARDIASAYQSGTTNAWIEISATDEDDAADRGPRLTNLEKLYWKKEKITKGDLIQYYEAIADTILPHLLDRPESLNRHPNGIDGENFFHKDMDGYLPPFVKSHQVFSRHSERSINYLLCQNKESLLYMVNLGCIEINPWLSRIHNLDCPDYTVIDIDPNGRPFRQVIEVAQAFHEVLEEIQAPSSVKTSGSTGLHIIVATKGQYDFEVGRNFALEVCRVVHRRFPKITSIERSPSKRRDKIYLDYLQNRRGSTLAAPYCVRPKPGATVSAPVTWSEVVNGLTIEEFSIHTMLDRIKQFGDLWSEAYENVADLIPLIEKIKQIQY